MKILKPVVVPSHNLLQLHHRPREPLLGPRLRHQREQPQSGLQAAVGAATRTGVVSSTTVCGGQQASIPASRIVGASLLLGWRRPTDKGSAPAALAHVSHNTTATATVTRDSQTRARARPGCSRRPAATDFKA